MTVQKFSHQNWLRFGWDMVVYNMWDYQRSSYGLNIIALMKISGAEEVIQSAKIQFLEGKSEWRKEKQEWRSQEQNKCEDDILRKEDDADRRKEEKRT